MRIYKIFLPEEWADAEHARLFVGSADDIRDGFIHLSTADQLAGTLGAHFTGESGLVLAAFDADDLGDALKWEVARDGQDFPHLYGSLPMDKMQKHWPLALDGEGRPQLPEGL